MYLWCELCITEINVDNTGKEWHKRVYRKWKLVLIRRTEHSNRMRNFRRKMQILMARMCSKNTTIARYDVLFMCDVATYDVELHFVILVDFALSSTYSHLCCCRRICDIGLCSVCLMCHHKKKQVNWFGAGSRRTKRCDAIKVILNRELQMIKRQEQYMIWLN